MQLSLHSKWFPSGIGGLNADHQQQAKQARLLGAGVIGITATSLALTPNIHGLVAPLWFLLLLSAAIAFIAPLMRRALPCIAAAIPALTAYVLYIGLSHPTNQSKSALLLGLTLVSLAFVIDELIRRFWPNEIKGKENSRSFILLTGLATLLPFTSELRQFLSISSNTAIAVFFLFPLVATAAIFVRQQNSPDTLKSRSSSLFYIIIGSLVFMAGLYTCVRSDYFSSALIVSSLPLLATLFKNPVRKIAFAGAIPLLGGFLFLWRSLLNTRPGHLSLDSVNLAIALVVIIGIAAFLWKKITSPKRLKLALYADTLLHGLAILSLHLFFQKHLAEGPDFFAASLLGNSLANHQPPFPFPHPRRALMAADHLGYFLRPSERQ